jgi:hypothetical protein
MDTQAMDTQAMDTQAMDTLGDVGCRATWAAA